MQLRNAPVERKQLLRVGLVTPIQTIDPRKAGDAGSAMVLAQIYESPFAFPANAQHPEPRLFAEPLREEPAPRAHTHYSAGIRHGIHFSNGALLTADIVARSLSRAKANEGRARFEARGDRVHVFLNEPNARYDIVLAQSECGVVLDVGGTLYGTGAYVLGSGCDPANLARSSTIVLERNGEFRGATTIDGIEFAVYEPDADGTPGQLIRAIREGGVDFTTALTMEHVTRERLPMLPSLHPGDSTGILFFNTERPAVRHKLVRRAIAISLSLEKVVAQAFERNPVAFVAMSLLPPSMGRNRALLTPSRTQAEEIFRRGESPRPASLRLIVPWAPRPYIPRPLPVASEIARQLGEIGIRIDMVQPRNITEFFSTLCAGDWDLALAGWVADNPDPGDFFEALLSARNIPSNGEFRPNISRYRSDSMEEALRRHREAPSESHRKAVFDILLDEVPVLPIIHAPAVSVHSRRVRQTKIPSTGVPVFADFVMAD